MTHDTFPNRCDHGRAEQPCCPACATLREAEAVLADMQAPGQHAFPRSPLEVQILGLLKERAPLSLSVAEMASILEAPRPMVRRVCQAHTMLETLEHASHGRYRYAPWLPADA